MESAACKGHPDLRDGGRNINTIPPRSSQHGPVPVTASGPTSSTSTRTRRATAESVARGSRARSGWLRPRGERLTADRSACAAPRPVGGRTQGSHSGRDAALAHPGHEGSPRPGTEDQHRTACRLAVPHRNGAPHVGNLDALAVAAAVATRPPCQLGEVVLHFRTPSLSHSDRHTLSSSSALSSGPSATACKCSNIDLYRRISASDSRNRSPAGVST